MGSINREPITATTIAWKESDLTIDHLAKAFNVYRTIQLGSVIKPYFFNETSQSFTQITKEDINRAVLSMNLAGENVLGEYYLYTTCGAYDSQFLIPFIVSTLILFGLGVIAYIKRGKHSDDEIDVPFTVDGWFHVLRKLRCRSSDNSVEDSNTHLGNRLREWVKWYISDVDKNDSCRQST